MFDLNSLLKKINSWIKAVFGKEFNRLLGSSEEYFEAEESSYENDIISRTQEEIKELNQKEILRREQEKKENQQVNTLKVAQEELDVANALPSVYIESIKVTTAKADAIAAAEDALAAAGDMEDDIAPVEGTTAKADALKAAQEKLDAANALPDDIESVEGTTAKADALKAAQEKLDAANALPDDIEPVEGTTAKADAIALAKAALNTLQNENIFDIEECSDGFATVSGCCIVDEGLHN